MRLLRPEEVKLFTKETEMENFVKQQEDAYRTVIFKTEDGKYEALEDMPILVSLLDFPDLSAEVSEDTIREQMAGSKIMLRYPNGDSWTSFPVGPTSFRPLLKRIGAACPALSLGSTRARDEISPTDRASICNIIAKYNKGDTLAVIGDELVLGVLSSDYVKVPFGSLQKSMREFMNSSYERVEFVRSSISHESSSVEYRFSDDEIDKAVFDAFCEVGIDASDFECHVTLITSEIGLSGANLFPCVCSIKSGRTLPIGLPVKMEHVGDASVEKFEDNLKLLFASFRDLEERLQKMKRTLITNPADCLYNVGKKMGFSEKELKNYYEDMDAMYPISCKGIDIYQKMFELLFSSPRNDIQMMQMCENITRICFMRLESYDYPVVGN